jgi:hypothetical protein
MKADTIMMSIPRMPSSSRMNTTRVSLAPLLFASLALPLLGACSPTSQPASTTQPVAQSTATSTQPQTALGRMVDNGIREARAKLEKGNIDIGGHVSIHTDSDHHAVEHDPNLPKAEITPQGDLLIEGKAVAVTPAQRAMLLTYRQQIIDVAEAGMSMGVQGADLAGKAVSEVLGSVFSGKGEDFGKRMETEGKKLEAQGRQLCLQLEPMRATQQQLAATLPAFKPYATMTADDIDDCRTHGDSITSRPSQAEVQARIREEIRKGVRTSVQRPAADVDATSNETAN